MPPDHLPTELLSPPSRPPAGTGRVLLAIAPAAGLVPAASTIVAVALPAIMSTLGMGTTAIAWLVTGYLILVAVLQSPAGRLGDRFGHRPVLLSGTGLLVAASFGAALSPSAVPLVVARLLQGVAGALIVPNGLAVLRREVAFERRGQGMGGFLTTMAVGAVVGVTAGGVAVSRGGWRAAFLALGLVGLVALLVTAVAGWGAVAPPGPATGVAAEVDQAPTLRWGALAAPAVGIALVNLTLYVVMLLLPIRLEELGWSSGAVGTVLGVFLAATAAGFLVESRLSDRLGRPRAVAVGAAAGAVPLALATGVPSTLTWLLPLLGVAGTGLGVATNGLFTSGVSSARARTAGAASGLLSSARYVGSIFGSAALPVLLATVGPDGVLLLAAGASLATSPLLRTSGG